MEILGNAEDSAVVDKLVDKVSQVRNLGQKECLKIEKLPGESSTLLASSGDLLDSIG